MVDEQDIEKIVKDVLNRPEGTIDKTASLKSLGADAIDISSIQFAIEDLIAADITDVSVDATMSIRDLTQLAADRERA